MWLQENRQFWLLGMEVLLQILESILPFWEFLGQFQVFHIFVAFWGGNDISMTRPLHMTQLDKGLYSLLLWDIGL